MKYDKFFALAKEAGIEEAELYIGESFSLSCYSKTVQFWSSENWNERSAYFKRCF